MTSFKTIGIFACIATALCAQEPTGRAGGKNAAAGKQGGGEGRVGRNYGRSVVLSQQGIAATSQVIASQVGAQILARGGFGCGCRHRLQRCAGAHRTFI